jgi:hypothetical protein
VELSDFNDARYEIELDPRAWLTFENVNFVHNPRREIVLNDIVLRVYADRRLEPAVLHRRS